MARKLIERKIGERFDYNGLTVEVVETEYHICDKCAFFEKIFDFCHNIKCANYERSDHKNIYFKEVKK